MGGTISTKDFRRFCQFIYGRCGINLHEGKRDLVRSRLARRLRALGLSSYKDYFDRVFEDDNDQEIVYLLDAISTNVTYFFREEKHFDFLTQEVLPALVGKPRTGANDCIKAWSAGCSSGEEPYSLAITLSEFLEPHSQGCKLLGTDLSTSVLQKAKQGVYEAGKLENIPRPLLRKYFNPHGDGVFYQVAPRVKSLLRFARLNLMHTFPFKGRFDIIFCRNVMIYFDKPTQETLVNKFSHVLNPGGYLMIGHSESLTSIKHDLQYIQPAIYRKKR
ncbi:MAG: protein-glutamate O-methyltransferase [Deltaproteobacteria bacterium]|nr:protein-glutamate O-methyltransferase [Candidatus Anaeroferrophillus wilburensis]MBN2889762.1 protein-glutamate O-methyltransferase [Deltaproteobacteria bacterium]